MTDQDVAVATPSDEDSAERPGRSIAEQLVEQARTDGVDLVGPGGLLSNLTKQVLETGLEVEMEEHLGYEKHSVEGRNGVPRAPIPERNDVSMKFIDILAWDSSTDWDSYEVAHGDGMAVLAALEALWLARTKAEAVDAYWRLDNVAIVSGGVYAVALPSVRVAIRAAVHGKGYVREFATQFIEQVVRGFDSTHTSKSQGTVAACRDEVRRSIEQIYLLLADTDQNVRQDAASILGICETDPGRLAQRRAWALEQESEPKAREALRQLLRA